MKKLIVIIMLVGFNYCYSQQVTYPIKEDSSIVIVSTFKGKGKVFGKDYTPNSIELPNYKSGVNLNSNELLKVENIVTNNFGKKYKKYWRQYLGFIDSDGNIFVFLHLEKFNKNASELLFNSWETTVTVVNTEWDKDITADYIVNLKENKLSLYYDWLNEIR